MTKRHMLYIISPVLVKVEITISKIYTEIPNFSMGYFSLDWKEKQTNW